MDNRLLWDAIAKGKISLYCNWNIINIAHTWRPPVGSICHAEILFCWSCFHRHAGSFRRKFILFFDPVCYAKLFSPPGGTVVWRLALWPHSKKVLGPVYWEIIPPLESGHFHLELRSAPRPVRTVVRIQTWPTPETTPWLNLPSAICAYVCF